MRNKHAPAVIIASAIAGLIVVLYLIGFFWPFRILHDQIFNPIGRAVVHTTHSISEGFGFVGNLRNLSHQNAQQADEILQLKQQLSTLKEVAHENDVLRTQLQFNKNLSLDLAPARVVATDVDTTQRFLTIDRGSAAGLKKGMAVVSNGALIGTIDQVNDYSSRVFLVSDPEFRIRGTAQDGRAQGIVSGQLGSGYIFDQIAQSDSVGTGEMVITNGSGLVPRGILIGQVEQVNHADNAVFQSALLRPLVDVSRVELVFVVLGLKQ